MKLDFSKTIKQLSQIQKRFNETNNPTEMYALLQAVNYIADDLQFTDDHWLIERCRLGMLRENGIDTD